MENADTKAAGNPRDVAVRDAAVISFPGIELKLPGTSVHILLAGLAIIGAIFVYGSFFSERGVQVIGGRLGVRAQYMQNDPKDTIEFSRTFVFWVPERTNVDKKPFEARQYDELHRWLTDNMGGYTRWKVEGGSGGEKEIGWFYQASLDRKKADVKPESIYQELKRLFKQENLYIVATTHNTR